MRDFVAALTASVLPIESISRTAYPILLITVAVRGRLTGIRKSGSRRCSIRALLVPNAEHTGAYSTNPANFGGASSAGLPSTNAIACLPVKGSHVKRTARRSTSKLASR